jgi:hypothetical protein
MLKALVTGNIGRGDPPSPQAMGDGFKPQNIHLNSHIFAYVRIFRKQEAVAPSLDYGAPPIQLCDGWVTVCDGKCDGLKRS